MPMQSMPNLKSNPYKLLEINRPFIGGINLQDIEYEQELNQSPYMLNMMYRKQSFGKRYGQNLFFEDDLEDKVYSIVYFKDYIIAHIGKTMYAIDEDTKECRYITIHEDMPERKGLFYKYAQNLYYLCGKKIYQYKMFDGNYPFVDGMFLYQFKEIEPYIPEVLINCDPAGPNNNGNSDTVDDYNIIGLEFKEIYHGDGTSTDFYIYGDEDDIIDWTVKPTIEVDGVITKDFTVDSTNKKITFTTAPSKGNLNVEITLSLKESAMVEDREHILNSKYWTTFGGNNNSCLFFAGGGDSKLYYSNAYDATYFPENNWIIIGNEEKDITGFGLQYNVLIVFKPNEMYSIYSYTQTSSNTIVEEDYGLEAFKAMLVNPRIGCDAPNSIQLINNQLTWFNSVEGVCTLVSTSIADERNVRTISRNINRGNTNDNSDIGLKGILDLDEDLSLIQSLDYDSKYFLVFPTSGYCYMWDYEQSPFYYTSSKVTDPRTLTWFIFDHFNVSQFLKVKKNVYYISTLDRFKNNLVKLNDTLFDLDFDGDGKADSINAFCMTSFIQFDAPTYLKNVPSLYVQCRGDVNSEIEIHYYTEESSEPEIEGENIITGCKSSLWNNFAWNAYTWTINIWGEIFRRRCGLKKVQRVAFLFTNPSDNNNNNISITYLAMDYQLVRQVK